VIVEDVNDNEPTFENDVYFLTTEENVEVGTALDKILAVDGDFGLNAKIRSDIFIFYRHAQAGLNPRPLNQSWDHLLCQLTRRSYLARSLKKRASAFAAASGDIQRHLRLTSSLR
jgi:hypothetical protein